MRDQTPLQDLALDIIVYTTASALAIFWLGLLASAIIASWKLFWFAVSL